MRSIFTLRMLMTGDSRELARSGEVIRLYILITKGYKVIETGS
jgi:hypothetical protein